MLSGALRDPSGAVDSEVIRLVRQAFRDNAGPVPRPLLGTVLVLDEHFGADLERCQVPGCSVRLFPLGEKAVPVHAFLELPRLPPRRFNRLIRELVRLRHELEGIGEPSAVNHHSWQDLCLGVVGVAVSHDREHVTVSVKLSCHRAVVAEEAFRRLDCDFRAPI